MCENIAKTSVKLLLKWYEIFGGNVESDYLCTRFSEITTAQRGRAVRGNAETH